jgi:uncharacterized DUF497 family protein
LNGWNFEWDASKAASNVRQHRVTFEEAKTVWNDPNRIEELDVVHTTEREIRFYVLGLSERLRLLLVIFTERNETIRLISARRANQAETRRYTGQV